MLLLSRISGQEVLGPDGRVAGRVADLTVRLDEQAGPHLVERLLVRRHRAPDLLVPWAAIESFENTCVLVRDTDDLTTFAITSTTDALDDDEILLVRDVLDTQIVDLVGQRLARVADVVLTRIADDRFELVGAEVGSEEWAATRPAPIGGSRRRGLRRVDRPAPDLRARSRRPARHPTIRSAPPRRGRARCAGQPTRHRVGR